MKDLKQIIVNRIQSIIDLQNVCFHKQFDQTQNNKYEILLEHKKAERHRGIRENQLLMSMNSLSISDLTQSEELYIHTVEICSMYNKEFEKYKEKPSVSMHENLRKLYCEFFSIHGFKQKCQQVSALLENNHRIVNPSILFGWLGEWSKKIYSQMLQKQIQKQFNNRERERHPKLNANSIVLALQKKRSQDQSIIQNNNQLSQIFLVNRANIYSYFLDQLQSYYKLCGMEGVDQSYLKLIRKKYQKQQFLKLVNSGKAIESLIQTSNNKQINVNIKKYYNNFYQKFPKQLQVINSRPAQNIKRRKSLSPIKKKVITRNATEPQQQEPIQNIQNESKLLTPKISQFEFLRVDDIESKLRRIKLLNKPSKNYIQFPGIVRKSFQKHEYIIGVVSNSSTNLSTSSASKRQIEITLQQKLKNQEFFKCQGFKSKTTIKENPNAPGDNLIYQKAESPAKVRKLLSYHLDSQYDDKKMKISKKFQLSDLRINNRISVLKKSIAQHAE